MSSKSVDTTMRLGAEGVDVDVANQMCARTTQPPAPAHASIAKNLHKRHVRCLLAVMVLCCMVRHNDILL